MTDTFFDLQRFAVLVGGQSSFTWQGGETFGAGASAAVGTSSNPAYLVATGGASEAGNGTDVYLSGEKSYNFSLEDKNGWEIKLGTDNVAHVTNGEEGLALSGLTGDAAAALTINGEFAEAIGADVTTATGAKANLTADGVITFNKAVDNATINLQASESVVLNKGGNDVVINDGAFNGIDIAKKVTLTSSDGTVAQIVTGNNSITMSNGNVTEIKAAKDTNVTIGSDQVISGAKGVTLKTASNGFNVPTTVNGTTWTEISGGVSSVAFDSVGSAKIENTGAVTVVGQDGAIATVQNLDNDGATVNGIKVATALTETDPATVAFSLETIEGGGISAVNVGKALGRNLVVTGDQMFNVKAGQANYLVATNTNNAVTFNATGSQINLAVEKDKYYAASGGNAQFLFAENATNVSLNSGVTVQLGTAEGVTATASDATAGIDNLNGLDIGSKVSVAGDDDGFTATFDAVEGTDAVVFEVNNASIRAEGIDAQAVSISINGAGTDALITGMSNTDKVSVGGTGITYHFKDESGDNAVNTSSGEAVYVTLDGTGAIADAMDDFDYKKLKENDQGKWDNVASIGNDQYQPDANGDTVPANRSDVYEEFYDLATSAAGQQTIATFAKEDAADGEPSTVSNPTGVQIFGRDNSKTLAENAHITLTAGSAVGAAPINIQRNESAAVVDAVVDLRNATLPSTVAVGTIQDTVNGDVTASHTIYLSNAGTGYAEIGEYATGQNQIFAGTGGAQVRHDGERATIVGNSGNDTIWAGKYDIVSGGTGADQFYDSADYTITDYDASQGDALIATRLRSINDITKENIKFNYNAGNEVSFGESRNSFTLGEDQNAPLVMNVAVMDVDANIVGSRHVVLAGANGGAVDASALSDGALIIADADRNGNAGDAVVGTASNDEIYVGANDYVNGGAGNDYITISGVSAASGDGGAMVAIGQGQNTVSGWTFGFDKNAGATELIAAEGYRGSFENDRLMVTDANGTMLFEETSQTSNHGQYDVLINGKKYMAIRTNDSNNTNPISYGLVEDNSQLADVYIAERAGVLTFGEGVTQDLGVIELGGASYRDITFLSLNNNSEAVVLGTSNRETVALGGTADVGANKGASLGAGNDVILSTGAESVIAGNALFFSAGDGRDSVIGFKHYNGVDADPDLKYGDVLVLDEYHGIYTGTGENGGKRIEFVTSTGDDRVFLYETGETNNETMYQIKIGDFNTKLAKIGDSSGANVFNFSDRVDYYVGSSAQNAQDTLVVGNDVANAKVWLDGTNGTTDTNVDEQYYRGIAVVDAGAATNTNVQLVGWGNNNTLYGGGDGTTNSLWGGAGDNALFGSENGQDTFFYVRSAGAYLQGVDDTVTGGKDEVYNYSLNNGDIVWLGDTTVDDILNTEVTDNAVSVNFKNGGSITVNGTDDVRFLINQGTESWVTAKDSSGDKFVKES